MEVSNLGQSIMMFVMMSGLLKNNLKRSLVKTYPRDCPDMLVRVERYARIKGVFTEDETPASSIIGEKQNKKCSLRQEERI